MNRGGSSLRPVSDPDEGVNLLDPHELAAGKLAALLTTDSELERRIEASPGLRWKAFNVKKHAGLGE